MKNISKFYKAPDGSVHCIDPDFTHLLPNGCEEITEAEAMTNPAPTPEQLATQIRSERDAKLQASTWLVERHREELEAGTTTLTTEQYQALLQYRQALRDITEQETFPQVVNWPELPGGL